MTLPAAFRTTHGHKPKNSPASPEYIAWCGMKARCHNPKNPKYPEYGARGIEVCDGWRSDFSQFFRDMGTRPGPAFSLERKDVNGDYEPDNCRWATKTDQSRNRRYLTRYLFRGEKLLVCEMAELTGVDQAMILARLNGGWPVELAAIALPGSRRPVQRFTKVCQHCRCVFSREILTDADWTMRHYCSEECFEENP
jgi:hypothetical protein